MIVYYSQTFIKYYYKIFTHILRMLKVYFCSLSIITTSFLNLQRCFNFRIVFAFCNSRIIFLNLRKIKIAVEIQEIKTITSIPILSKNKF